MDQEFIKLMQILLGNPNPSAHKLNPDYAVAINNHVNDLNSCFGIKSCEDVAFIGESSCFSKVAYTTLGCGLAEMYNHQVIGPVPFASSGENPFFAVIGLNPLFDKKNNSGCKEKHLAGNSLSEYAAFYNSNSLNGVFPFVFNPLGKYYRNIFILIYSLCKGEHKNWDTIFPKKDKAEIVAKYKALVESCPIIVPEIIPFHSSSTKINIDTLYRKMPIYKDYHKELLKVLHNKMDKDGIIFVHGEASCKAIKGQMSDDLKYIKEFHLGKKTTHLFGIWNGRVVVILSSFVGSRNGAFSSNDNIISLINDILHYISSHNKIIPCNCHNMKHSDQNASPQILISLSDTYNMDLERREERNNQEQEDVNSVQNKRRRGEVGKVREAFSDDSKGLRTGQLVEFPESRKKGAKLIEGILHHIFLNADSNVEEAKIIVDNGTKYGKKYYRELDEIEKVDE